MERTNISPCSRKEVTWCQKGQPHKALQKEQKCALRLLETGPIMDFIIRGNIPYMNTKCFMAFNSFSTRKISFT